MGHNFGSRWRGIGAGRSIKARRVIVGGNARRMAVGKCVDTRIRERRGSSVISSVSQSELLIGVFGGCSAESDSSTDIFPKKYSSGRVAAGPMTSISPSAFPCELNSALSFQFGSGECIAQ